MPKIIQFAPPNIASPGAGLGALYAAAGQAQGQAQRHDEQRQQSQQFQNFGMGLAGQAFGNFLGEQRDNNRFEQQTRQKQELQAHETENRRAFLQELYGSNPEMQQDPDWQAFDAAVGSGALSPKDAITGWEAIKNHKRTDTTKQRGQDMTAEDKATGRGIQQQGMDLRGIDTASKIDQRTGLLGVAQQNAETRGGLLDVARGGLDERVRADQANEGLGQQRIDETGRSNLVKEGQGQQNADTSRMRATTPKPVSLDNDPAYKQAQNYIANATRMVNLLQHQIDAGQKDGQDTSALEQSQREWLDKSTEAMENSRKRLNALRGGSGQQGMSSPISRKTPVVPVSQPDPRETIRQLKAKGMTPDQIEQYLQQQGYQ